MLNYLKSGNQALVEIIQDIEVLPGDFHIIGKQLGVAIGGGGQGDTIAVALAGVFELDCEGDAFDPGTPLNFSVANLAMYAGAVLPDDFGNVGIAGTPGGGPITRCSVKINTHIATLTT